MKYLLTFDDPVAAETSLSGGKGANLARLTQWGFNVPRGFVVTSQAYQEFIAGSGNLLDMLKDFSYDDPAQLLTQSETLRASLATVRLPETVGNAVRATLENFAENTAFAVRSSSTMEDLSEAAFAGQHDTYLNWRGCDNILGKIRDCFLSLWHDRAIAYRHRHGFDHRMASMAVVVQQMVQCDVAGVGFSINPVNGRFNEMIINAGYGLGETVVSGEEADNFVINKTDASVIESRITRKPRKIIADSQGTMEVAISEEEAGRSSLSTVQLEQLAELLISVEKAYRFPQDIEWGFANNALYLLQARPITTIPPRWTRDESAERFPNVITPLAWDFVEDGFHRSLNYSFHLMGLPPFRGKWFGMHDHYIYGNQSAVELYGNRAALCFSTLDELRIAIPMLRERFQWVQELPVRWSRDLDYYLIRIGEFMAEPLDGKDVKALWRFVREINNLGVEYFLPNIAISITQRTLYNLLLGLLKLAVGQDATSFFDRLTAYCETKTGVVNRELVDLAVMARSMPELCDILVSGRGQSIPLVHMDERFPAFALRFRKFLRDHGHREIDFDPYQPTWVDAPWVALDTIGLILQSPTEHDHESKTRELKMRMQQAELELFSRLPKDLHFFYNEVLRLTRLYTSLDDLEHYQTTRLTLPLRKGLKALGSRLKERGVLDDEMDLFFARLEALDRAVTEDRPEALNELAQAITTEKTSYLHHRASQPAWTLGDSVATEHPGDSLTGIPGSPGQAEGKVYIVKGPEDFAAFPKGAVLVARTTNPAWTTLFYNATAVITESGGPLSHGAVTAREMQIPAVMAIHGVLARLSNGCRVKVDGTGGRAYLLTD